MDKRNSRSSSQDLKKRPVRRGTSARSDAYRRQRMEQQSADSSNDLYSHSEGRSVDLLSMSSRARAKRSRSKLLIFNIVMSVVLVFSSISFIGAAMLDSKFLKNGSIDEKEDGDFANIIVSDNANVSYFLVCGVDLSEDLTDVIMVVCYDLANNEVSALQIPRDTFVGSDVNTGKINAVYGGAHKGESKIKALIRCINSKFGIPIDHYATITIQGMKNVIDIVGGVDIKLSKQMKLTDDTGKKDIHKYVGPGEVHFDGMWGVAFVRNRNSYAQADMGRIKAQRSFYAAVLKKMTMLEFSQLASIVTKCANDISTDLTLGQMLGYAQKMRELDLDDVTIMSVPGQSCTYKGLSSFSVHKQELADILNDHMRPYETSAITVDDMNITEIHSSYNSGYSYYMEDGSLSNFDTQAETTTGSAQ